MALLTTKLRPPRVATPRLERDRLLQLLPDLSGGGLALVMGPAGSGKTVAATMWAEQPGRGAGWLSLDRADNDPGRFWSYFAAACSVADQTIPRSVLAEVGGGGLSTPEQRLGGLINHVADAATVTPCVLDDYHVIENDSIHAALDYFMDQIAPWFALVITSRHELPLATARRRAVNQLWRLGADDLSFTAAETEEFVTLIAGKPLTKGAVTDLHNWTEGWPAGVYLATQSRPETLDVESRPTASTRLVVFDYLAEEVIALRDSTERNFLLQTAILDRFCAPLAGAVTGTSNPATMIRRLRDTNSFIMALDEEQHWHRYHHRFAEYLRAELTRTNPELVLKLHRRASRWYEANYSPDEAIDHALASGDITLSMSLIARHVHDFIADRRFDTVRRWLASIPDSEVRQRPTLTNARTLEAVYRGQLHEADRWIAATAQALDPAIATPTHGYHYDVQSTVSLLRGDVTTAVDAAQQAVEIAIATTSSRLGNALIALGAAMFWLDRGNEAAVRLEEALGILDPGHNQVDILRANGYLAVQQPDAALGSTIAKQALADAAEHGLRHHFLTSMPHLAIGRHLRQNGDPEIAVTHLQAALETARPITPLRTAYCLLEWAELQHTLDNDPQSAVAEARRLTRICPNPGFLADLVERASDRFRLELDNKPNLDLAQTITPREHAVLRLLPTPLTQREIASELFVSWNTVKTQVQAIYRKLDARSRTEAVIRARDLGLLEPGNLTNHAHDET